ncbi:MAG: chemotaxis protein CheW [Thermomicrobiales bacterium]
MSVAVARRSDQSAEIPANTLRLVRFMAGGGAFALPLDRVPEVVQLDKSAARPARGWASMWPRDRQPMPVADLAFVLGLTTARDSAARAVLLNDRSGAVAYGLAVDDVPVAITVAPDELQALPASVCPPGQTVLAASVVREADVLLVLDADALIARLAPSVVRGADGRVTELRPLVRRSMDTARLAPAPGAGRAPGPPRQDERVILLAPVEPADGSAGFQPAVPIAWVREVRASEPAHTLPESPPALLGLLAWRGYCLPVLDLAWRLTGIPSQGVGEPGARLLIVGPPAGDPLGVLLVSGVRGLVNLAPPAPGQPALSLPEPLDDGLLTAWTAARDGTSLALLAPAALFA